jgi:hypothetical protein
VSACSRRLTLLLLAVATAAASQEAGPFQRTKFEFPGTIQDQLLADVDGDGRLDVLIIHGAAGNLDDHRLAICRQDDSKGFLPCVFEDLPDTARALDVGPLDTAPGAELVLLTDEGILVSSWQGSGFGPPAALEAAATIFAGTDQDVPRPIDLLFDLDGGGGRELVLPTLEGPTLVRAGEAPQVLASPAEVSYSAGSRNGDINSFLRRHYQRRITAQHLTPDVFVEDYDGDGRKDVITMLDNVLRVFLQDEEGGLPTTPSLIEERSTIGDDELRSEFTGEATTFAQLDGDERADLIVMKWGSSEKRTRMDRAIFYSREDGGFSDRPDQVVRSESVFPDFDILDLNGDGRRDLVIPFFHVAPAQAVRVMTQNAIKIQFRLFLMRPDGRYAQGEGKAFVRVDRRVVLDYHLDILRLIFGNEAAPTGRIAPLLDFGADFNGDGYADLAADDGSDRLRIYWGNEQVRYGNSPDLVLPFESTLSYDLIDADGDGRTDLFGYHGTRPVREEIGGRHHAVKRKRRERERARRAEARRAREEGEEKAPEERVRLEILMSR